MPSNGTAAQVATEKKLYRIGEVSRLADLKPFVLRYWETEFPCLSRSRALAPPSLRQDDVDMVSASSVCSTTKDSPSRGRDVISASTMAPLKTESRSANHGAEGAAQLLSRKMLLDLRDTLRAFLTLLERR